MPRPSLSPTAISIRDVSKQFRSKTGPVSALSQVSLDVGPSEMVVLLGPSGCGKTTLLRSIAGLEKPDNGRIEINGEVVFSDAPARWLAPERRGIGMVFQSYALWPHMTVLENVAYPLKSQHTPAGELRGRVHDALVRVGCGDLEDRFPHQVSGGQQQRVALARALVSQRGVVLFDEPLAHVDAKVREQLRVELLSLQSDIGFAGLYVTHDQSEAMVLASRIVVMRTGRVEQAGTPEEIYGSPRSRYVADFVGSANFVRGTIRDVRPPNVVVSADLGAVVVATSEPWRAGEQVELFFRPEDVRLAVAKPDGPNTWECRVTASMFLGPNRQLLVDIGGSRYAAWTTSDEAPPAGSVAWMSIPPTNIGLLRTPNS